VVVNCVIKLQKNVTPSAVLLSLTCRTNHDLDSIIFFIGMEPYNIKLHTYCVGIAPNGPKLQRQLCQSTSNNAV
jgi:hypothetical protein